MNKELHDQLLADTRGLRDIVSRSSTEHIATWCFTKLFLWGGDWEKVPALVSPYRQMFFLMGLMSTTEEPDEPESFDENAWDRCVSLLNSVFLAYGNMYGPRAEEEMTNEWWQSREVAMHAFLHYFNTGLVATVEQMSRRFEAYLGPFEDVLGAEWGINGKRALEICDWIGSKLQKQIDDVRAMMPEELEVRSKLLDRAKKENWGFERIRAEAESIGWPSLMEKMSESISVVSKVRKSDLESKFGPELAGPFWELMVIRRGAGHSLDYITEHNPAESSPLFEIENGVAICPSFNALYFALLAEGERTVLSSPFSNRFLKHRDGVLEHQVEEEFKRILGEEAEYWSEVYETRELQHEHDLIIRWRKKVFVVEAKASPPREPFRDPDKAFTRIKRAFRSDRGLQKGFEQAERIRKRLASEQEVILYGKDRQRMTSLVSDDVDAVYCICVTRDDFGMLAIDLSLLLEKEEQAPYPWAVNVLALSTLADAYDYFGWGGDKLVSYLEERQQLHGRLLATDELEVAGFSVEHGSLQKLIEDQEAHKVHLPPSYSGVFDRVHKARGGGERVVVNPTEPHVVGIQEMLRDKIEQPRTREVDLIRPRSVRGERIQGRNERCACGSGKKYKYCCGQNK